MSHKYGGIAAGAHYRTHLLISPLIGIIMSSPYATTRGVFVPEAIIGLSVTCGVLFVLVCVLAYALCHWRLRARSLEQSLEQRPEQRPEQQRLTDDIELSAPPDPPQQAAAFGGLHEC